MKKLHALKGLFASKVGLSVVAIVAVAGAGTVAGTYANFTATPTTISSNAFATGTVKMSADKSSAIFNAANAKVGGSAVGTVTITNTGSLDAIYTLTGAFSGSQTLGADVNLKVYKDDTAMAGTPLYDGPLGSFTTAALGTFTANGDKHTFTFKATLPTQGTDTADNLLQGLAGSVDLTWSAVQA